MKPIFDKNGVRLVGKPDNYRDLGPVDISNILPLVEKISDEVWLKEDAVKENKFEVLGNTKHIIFKFTSAHKDPRECYETTAWHVWKSILQPVMESATQSYGHQKISFSKVMFARLPAHESIAPHRDGAGSNLTSHKVHIPLITNPKAVFETGGKTRHLQAGHAYEVNNIITHSAKNFGNSDRIHLIFEHFDAAASPSKNEKPFK